MEQELERELERELELVPPAPAVALMAAFAWVEKTEEWTVVPGMMVGFAAGALELHSLSVVFLADQGQNLEQGLSFSSF